MKDFGETAGASVPEEGEKREKDPTISMGDLVGYNFTVWSNEVKSTIHGDRALLWVSPHAKEYLTGYDVDGHPQYTKLICWGTKRIIQQLATMDLQDYPFVATMITYRDSSYQLAAALPKGDTVDDIVPF